MKKIVSSMLLFGAIGIQASAQWAPLCFGAEQLHQAETSQGHIAICMAGWTVEQKWTNHWAEALYAAKLKELGVEYLIAVKGPKDVAFESLEIETQKLADHIIGLLSKLMDEGKWPEIRVMAHSSGAYVAHNLFTHLLLKHPRAHLATERIRYYNLDGGIGTTVYGTLLNAQLVDKLKRLVPVYAYDPKTGVESANGYAMKELAEKYPLKSRLCVIRTSNSGCTAKWCLHETVITQLPHKPTGYDLKNDYGNINKAHPVCWEYLD